MNKKPSNIQIQKEFFEVFTKAMQTEPVLRAAFVFQLVDWSPKLAKMYEKPLKDAGMTTSFVDKVIEELSTIGLIRYKDGTQKPAWDVFLASQ